MKTPREIWVSEYDTCLNFESEEDANCIAGKGLNTSYTRTDLVHPLVEALRSARNGLEWYMQERPLEASDADHDMLAEIDAALAAFEQETK